MQGHNKSNVHKIEDLFQQRKSDTAIFLGSGQSINNISDKQWGNICTHDLWTVNNWVYHPKIVPNFYHIESKWYDYRILQRRLAEKEKQYKNVRFIFPRGKTIRMRDGGCTQLLRDIVPFNCEIYEYGCVSRDVKRTHKKFNADYSIRAGKLTKSYDMSVTMIFELLYKMGYSKIVTYGVDLHNSYYFWTGHPECGEVHHQTNKAHENKDPNLPHATHRIFDFIVDFNERWMKPNNKEIVVGHHDTALSKALRVEIL